MCIRDRQYIVQELLHFDIAKAASLVMRFQLVEICVIRQIALEVLWLAECIEIGKYGISLNLARVGDLDVIRVGVHAVSYTHLK